MAAGIIPWYARRDPTENRRKFKMKRIRLPEKAAILPCLPVEAEAGNIINGYKSTVRGKVRRLFSSIWYMADRRMFDPFPFSSVQVLSSSLEAPIRYSLALMLAPAEWSCILEIRVSNDPERYSLPAEATG